MSTRTIGYLRPRVSIQSRLANIRRVLCIGFVAIPLTMVLPTLSRAQTTSVQPLSFPKVTVFLADPELGVAGAYQDDGNTLYFEARTPEQSTQMSARLLDAAGSTIAISGHSMDDQWLAVGGFEPVSAGQSLSLAGALPAALENALDGTVFRREITALSNLAIAAAQVPPAAAAARIDAATAYLTSPNEVGRVAAYNYDATAANALLFVRDTEGNLSAAIGEIRIQTFVENFPDGENDDSPTGVLGRTEVSARILSASGKSLIEQIGGDDIPEGWDSDTTGMFRPGSLQPVDPIETSLGTGKAIRAAALMARFPSIATPEEADAAGNLAATLRDEGMFPRSASDSVLSSAASCGNCFRSDIQVWNKSLIEVAQHSGTVVLHYNNDNPSRFSVLEYSTIYCNHGTCPHHKPMNHACTYRGPWMGSYRFAPHWKITAPPPTPVSGYHSCHKTPYHLYSGKFWPVIHGHNCNDDSWTQIRAIKGERYDINASDNLFSYGQRCDMHDLIDPRAPGCSN
jgi:hypothetical protein